MSLPSLCLCSCCYECMSRCDRMVLNATEAQRMTRLFRVSGVGFASFIWSPKRRGFCTYGRHLNPGRLEQEDWTDVILKRLLVTTKQRVRCAQRNKSAQKNHQNHPGARMILFWSNQPWKQHCCVFHWGVKPVNDPQHRSIHILLVMSCHIFSLFQAKGCDSEVGSGRSWMLISDVGGLFVKMSVHYQVEWKMTRSTYDLPWRIINHFSPKKSNTQTLCNASTPRTEWWSWLMCYWTNW